MNIDHLDGGKLLEGAARGQSWRQCMQATLERDLQTISQERNEDVGFDSALVLMEDRPYRQIALQVLERPTIAGRRRLGTMFPPAVAARPRPSFPLHFTSNA
jgi:hypothetical protein